MSLPFNSRRSTVHSLHGMVACTQPLAAEAGLSILKRGGNAADAAIAVAAALNVTEPCSTGIGGDAFAIFYNAETKDIRGINASGRAPASLTLKLAREQGVVGDALPATGTNCGLAVTVPGAAAGWVDTVEMFGSGKVNLRDVLQPAIEMAKEGVPIACITANVWSQYVDILAHPKNPDGSKLLIAGKSPAEGDVFHNPDLAATLDTLAEEGKAGFYSGRVANAMVACAKSHGGCLTLDDLAAHKSTIETPLSVSVDGIRLQEMPPNGQGITALLALNIIKHVPGFDSMEPGSADYLHVLIEVFRLAFADAFHFIGDPELAPIPIHELLSDEYGKVRAALIKMDSAIIGPERGSPFASCDTVYFTVTDSEGNACSFINSNYKGFGTGLVPTGCGFTLQNRGCGFCLEEGHANCVSPMKRPYHTLMPAMATHDDTGELYATFGIIGAFRQPQAHVQVLLNLVRHGMSPQAALDAPRFCIWPRPDARTSVDLSLEEGIDPDVVVELRRRGHNLEVRRGMNRCVFGRGQIIRRVWAAGSDPRGDGQAIGY